MVLNPLNHTKSNDQTQEVGLEGESGGDVFKPQLFEKLTNVAKSQDPPPTATFKPFSKVDELSSRLEREQTDNDIESIKGQ